MKYVKVEETAIGFHLDASRYLYALGDLQEHLLPGAWLFASDSDHYDFHSLRCVKDLNLQSISQQENADLTLRFGPNTYKHEAGLTLTYRSASSIDFQITDEGYFAGGIGIVMLDEVLPSDLGCTHEIELTNGRLYIESADIHAQWE
ncbi:hypothetical protein [Nocardia sp. 852002-20019_SCH5090214]|uniref:hypothetical protein n=1 Tax=Nocardia sp. 852002-20019_SCH5090214 TaxID=1834087 RepID=UPI0012EABBF9|nr:hypothetical protein [Nocardia sp. 852002-20019_SCH5090214]